MILKGNSRRGALDLALHLSNEVDNEAVTIAETRGMVADNLYDGFREWEMICNQSNAKNPFYSLSVNPDPNQRDWAEKEWQKAINHIEDRLGLNNQPRAIIFHEKIGEDGNLRKHAHIVWSRIKTDNGQLKAVHLGYDYYTLKTCARALAKEFGLELRYGERKSQNYDLAKSHGKNRDPQTSEERKQLLTKLWNETKTAEAFTTVAANAGYIVAQGERRAFVIVDIDGQTHALARQIEGVKTKEVKTRLDDPASYPSVDQAKDQQKIQKLSVNSVLSVVKEARTDLSREQRQMQKLRRMAQKADNLTALRHKKLKSLKLEITNRHQQELHDLKRIQRAQTTKTLRKRADKKPTGFVKTVSDTIGITHIIQWLDTVEDQKRNKIHDKQNEKLETRQLSETKRLNRRKIILGKQAIRESQAIRRLAKQLAIQHDLAALAKEPPNKRTAKATGLRLA